MDEQPNQPAEPPPGEPTEEQLRAAYEEQLKRIRVDDVLIQTVVSLLNLGGRKAGLTPDTAEEKDLEQVRQAIEGTRALLPLVEEALGPDAGQIRTALSQLQLAYARHAAAPGGGEGEGGEGEGGEQQQRPPAPGPAQASGRLWVPGQ
jgi:hypothetical protein